jgi:hypothetical protein
VWDDESPSCILRFVKVELPTVEDPIGEALHFLRMSGTFYCRSEFREPWALGLPAIEDSLMLHVVTSGKCFLEVPGTPTHELKQGDLALVPHAWKQPYTGLSRQAPSVRAVPRAVLG